MSDAPATEPEVVDEVISPSILVVSADRTLFERVAHIGQNNKPAYVTTHCERLTELGPLLERDDAFNVIVAGGLLTTAGGLKRLALIHEEMPRVSIILAVDELADVEPADLVRAGALDLVAPTHASDGEISASLVRAMRIRHRIGGDTSLPQGMTERHGTVYTVASGSGGAGKTFLATNLAWFLAKATGGKSLIIDLDLQFGEVTAALQLHPRYTVADLIRYDEGDWYLAEHFEDFTTTHESGLQVLAATQDPADAWAIKPTDVERIIAAARRRFDHIVIDTSPAITEPMVAALQASDEILVIATTDVPSIRNMRVFLETVERFDISRERMRLLLNKAEKGVSLQPPVIEKIFPQGFEATLPHSRDVGRSLNAGQPVLAASPTAAVSVELTAALQQFLPAELRKSAGTSTKRGGIFRRKNA